MAELNPTTVSRVREEILDLAEIISIIDRGRVDLDDARAEAVYQSNKLLSILKRHGAGGAHPNT